MASERALLVAAGGGIGDTLLAGVVAHALRSRYAHVDALVLPAHRAIAQHDPAIERVHLMASPVPTADDLGERRDRARSGARRHSGARGAGTPALLGAVHAPRGGA
jgi:ADP-heptose:LPS heptosyltransferase